MKIVIDGRIIGSSTGRYVEQLIKYLAKLDQQNQYVVLLKPAVFGNWQPPADNFRKLLSSAEPYTIAEQSLLAWQLYRLRADLVHFTMPNYPVFYFKRFVVTIHDLTLLDFKNIRQVNWLAKLYKYWFKPLVLKLVISSAVRHARAVMTPSNYVRTQILKRFNARPDKIVTTYEAAEPLSNRDQAVPPLAEK